MTKTKKLKPVSEEDFGKRFGYQLARANDDRGLIYDGVTGREMKSKEYRPRVNVLLRSSIIWDGSDAVYEVKDPKTGKYDENSKLISGHRKGRQIIRYYDGCTSLFEDEQPKDIEVIKRLVDSTRDVILVDGYLFVYGYDEMLKKYLDICSWNGESPYRVPTIDPVFVPMDAEASAEKLEESLEMVEEAMTLAKKASKNKMMFHANFLGVELVDQKTNNPHTEKVVRVKYREMAMKNPAAFIKTYNDESIELSGFITKALDEGKLSKDVIPNQIVWKEGGSIVCDVSGLTSREGILNKLIEFAKTDKGAGFKEVLESLYK